MSLSDIATIAGVVSSIAVLISLIYLALQVRQSRLHTAAQISQARVHSGMQQQELYIVDPAVAELFMRGIQGDPDMSPVDGFRLHFLFTNTFMMSEDDFRQYKAGLISAERHDGFVKRLSRGLQSPGYRAAWAVQRDGFEPDFQAYMDSLVQRAREMGPTDMGAAYQTAMAAERGWGKTTSPGAAGRLNESATS
jgi:hypothetical protein